MDNVYLVSDAKYDLHFPLMIHFDGSFVNVSMSIQMSIQCVCVDSIRFLLESETRCCARQIIDNFRFVLFGWIVFGSVQTTRPRTFVRDFLAQLVEMDSCLDNFLVVLKLLAYLVSHRFIPNKSIISQSIFAE